jgi:hypothetical protein
MKQIDRERVRADPLERPPTRREVDEREHAAEADDEHDRQRRDGSERTDRRVAAKVEAPRSSCAYTALPSSFARLTRLLRVAALATE